MVVLESSRMEPITKPNNNEGQKTDTQIKNEILL